MGEFLSLMLEKVGLCHLSLAQLVMLLIGCLFIHLAVSRKMEPYVLLPIGIGIILGNLPLIGLVPESIYTRGVLPEGTQSAGVLGVIFYYGLYRWNILPPLIFLCLGAMTDFGPLIANPKTLLFGASAQIGIFIAFLGALWFGFDLREAASVGIIGGADGPTAIFIGAKLAPSILIKTAVAAYIYMAFVPFIQPPIMKLLTTKEERAMVMKQLRTVSKLEKMLFPVVSMIVVLLLVPLAAPLVGMFMIGNLFRESGVVPRLTKTAQNELMNLVTIFLMLCVGAGMTASRMLQLDTLFIMFLGFVAFTASSAGGILLAKFLNLFWKNKVNPLIGSAGVSAVPMAARISQKLGQEANPRNFLLMHAMGPNVAGVIGSAVAAGIFLSLLGSK